MEQGAREIRGLLDRQVAAIAAKDVNAMMADMAENVVMFDVLPPLGRTGREHARKKTEDWFGGYAGKIGYEVRDLTITAEGNMGLAHFLCHVSGTLKGGAAVDMWVRNTVCLRRLDGRWQIVHEHVSVPFTPDAT